MQGQGPCSAFFGGRSCCTPFFCFLIVEIDGTVGGLVWLLLRKHVCYFVHAQITMMFTHHCSDALHCNYNVDHKLFLLLLHTPVCLTVFVFCLGNSEHIAALELPWSNMCVNKGTLWCLLKMVSVQSPLPHHLIGIVKLLSIRCRHLLKEKLLEAHLRRIFGVMSSGIGVFVTHSAILLSLYQLLVNTSSVLWPLVMFA